MELQILLCFWRSKETSLPLTLVPDVVLTFEDTEVCFPGDKILNLGLILLNIIFSDALISVPPPINSVVNDNCGYEPSVDLSSPIDFPSIDDVAPLSTSI